MSMNATNIEYWHDRYEQLEQSDPDMHDAIDEAYGEVVRVVRENELKCAGDDRAEQLVAAIARYFVESHHG